MSIYAVAEGFVKSYRELPSGRRVIGSFLFPRDIFGLAQKGHYVNTAQAISPVTLFRFPLTISSRCSSRTARCSSSSC